jgi:MFS family permease
MPLLIAVLSAYFGVTKRLSWLSSGSWGLLSIYLSTLIGVFVYGYSVGWQYVTNDTESQAVFMATAGIQTVTFFIAFGLSSLALKRYNNTP